VTTVTARGNHQGDDPIMIDEEEELSDYRVVLSCIRKRLARYGMTEAMERLERLDDAIVQAIMDRAMRSASRLLN